MLQVAESPDCLGQPVARGMPEKPRQVAPATPAVEAATPVVVARELAAPALDTVSVPTEPKDITPPAIEPVGVAEGFGTAAADAAFERFMSEDIEDEPSRDWILAG
jgi:hypothetical protein